MLSSVLYEKIGIIIIIIVIMHKWQKPPKRTGGLESAGKIKICRRGLAA